MSSIEKSAEAAASSLGTLGERLIALIDLLHNKVRPSYHTTHLTAARMSALRIIIENGRTTGGQIAQAEQVTQATITRVLDGLSESGFIVREGSRQDRRIVNVRATEAGRAAFRETVESQVERLADDLATLSAEDRAEISDAVRHLERVFQNG